jgi:hypothetical protein
MKIQNVTIVVRGTKGELLKGVLDAQGELISGDARVQNLSALIEEDASDDAGLPSESGLGDETDGGAVIDATGDVGVVE